MRRYGLQYYQCKHLPVKFNQSGKHLALLVQGGMAFWSKTRDRVIESGPTTFSKQGLVAIVLGSLFIGAGMALSNSSPAIAFAQVTHGHMRACAHAHNTHAHVLLQVAPQGRESNTHGPFSNLELHTGGGRLGTCILHYSRNVPSFSCVRSFRPIHQRCFDS